MTSLICRTCGDVFNLFEPPEAVEPDDDICLGCLDKMPPDGSRVEDLRDQRLQTLPEVRPVADEDVAGGEIPGASEGEVG